MTLIYKIVYAISAADHCHFEPIGANVRNSFCVFDSIQSLIKRPIKKIEWSTYNPSDLS